MSLRETIGAIATPAGKGGIGIVRVSGPLSSLIAEKILGFIPKPRHATFCQFLQKEEVIDEGIALYFPHPHSYTGEEVLELQGHGGPIVLDRLLKVVIENGARLARAGEFSERAFLNNKMDLTQIEAVADLINAESEQAVKSAVRSLTGEFSKEIHFLVAKLIELRTLIEAAIDFPEEEIDFIQEQDVTTKVSQLLFQLQKTLSTAKQGALLREGMTVVIAGKPNVGKSSLLNCLSGSETAIVTEIAGTTRDVLREHIHLDGMPLHILDTAGLRDTTDVVEKIGVQRARAAIESADLVLQMVDVTKKEIHQEQSKTPTIIIENKIDLINEPPGLDQREGLTVIKLSVKKNQGITVLKKYLKKFMGFNQQQEGVFIARARHLDALKRAEEKIQQGLLALKEQKAAELLAEDLRQAQKILGEITGEFAADDLLGEIFSSFCIGK